MCSSVTAEWLTIYMQLSVRHQQSLGAHCDTQSHGRVHITHLISPHRTSFRLNWVRCEAIQFSVAATNQSSRLRLTRNIWKMLGPFATASRFTLPFTRCRYCRTQPLSHAACASMSTTTTTTTTTTTRDRGDRYDPIEWAQINALQSDQQKRLKPSIG